MRQPPSSSTHCSPAGIGNVTVNEHCYAGCRDSVGLDQLQMAAPDAEVAVCVYAEYMTNTPHATAFD